MVSTVVLAVLLCVAGIVLRPVILGETHSAPAILNPIEISFAQDMLALRSGAAPGATLGRRHRSGHSSTGPGNLGHSPSGRSALCAAGYLAGDPDFGQWFQREARAAATIGHPHVVRIFDYGEIDGRLFICMSSVRESPSMHSWQSLARCRWLVRSRSSSKQAKPLVPPMRRRWSTET